MVQTFITILHVLVCILLLFVILLQPGTDGTMALGGGGGGAGNAFGGGSGISFLQRVTTVLAAIFFVTSLTLSFMSGHHRSVTDDIAPPVIPHSAPVPSNGKAGAKAPASKAAAPAKSPSKAAAPKPASAPAPAK